MPPNNIRGKKLSAALTMTPEYADAALNFATLCRKTNRDGSRSIFEPAIATLENRKFSMHFDDWIERDASHRTRHHAKL